MSRTKGDGEGSLKQKVVAGRKVWFARWVRWVGGKQTRPKKIIGDVKDFPSKREAREELNRIIRETAGAVTAMPAFPTFAGVFERYVTLNKPRWSKAQTEAVGYVMRRAVLPQIGERNIAQLTYEPVQTVLNHMAEMPLLIGEKNKYTRTGYGESAIKKARTYMRAVFEFAIEEGLVARNPARKLMLPETRKPCGRHLTMEEVHRLLGAATGRERIILRLLLIGGLRPAELFALKANDIGTCLLRVDEALKERERRDSGRRIGDTKTNESDSSVAISASLEAEVRAWAETRPTGSLLFPTETGTTWRIGNYLKRVLKPLAASVGISDITHQCLRRSCATHFKGEMKDRQTQMRHADPATTLRHYQKSIPESQRAAVEAMDVEFSKMAPKMALETKAKVN